MPSTDAAKNEQATASFPTVVLTSGTTTVTITTNASYLATFNSLKATAEKSSAAAIETFAVSALMALLSQIETSATTVGGSL